MRMLAMGCGFAILPPTLEPATTGKKLSANKNLNEIKINNYPQKTTIIY